MILQMFVACEQNVDAKMFNDIKKLSVRRNVFEEDAEAKKAINIIDQKIANNGENKAELLIRKSVYEQALYKYDAAKISLLAAITQGGDKVKIGFLIGVVDFFLGNDIASYKNIKNNKEKIISGKYNEITKESFLNLSNAILPILERALMSDKMMRKREKFIISNKKYCHFIDTDPGEYTVTWSGKCDDGLTEGYGALLYSDKALFKGEMHKGDFIKGIMSWPDGSSYEGTMKNGVMDGAGCLIYKDGNEYCGEMKNNEKNGEGIFKFTSGKKLKGVFKNDRFLKGEAFCANGKKTDVRVTRSFKVGWRVFLNCK